MVEIQIQHRGRLGNQMIRHMFALELAGRIGTDRARLVGDGIPEWGISLPEPGPLQGRSHELRGHAFNLDQLAFLARAGLIQRFEVSAWAQRMEYFGPPERYRPVFPCEQGSFHPVAEDEILAPVRAEEILSGRVPNYSVLPVSFYRDIIIRERLRPVFMGQLEDNWYTAMLRDHFPTARFLPMSDPMTDFRTIYHARHVVLSISSFAWVASWLSPHVERIHFPVAGILQPLDGETLLMPVSDDRYRFYQGQLNPDFGAGSPAAYRYWVREADVFRPCGSAVLAARVMEACPGSSTPQPRHEVARRRAVQTARLAALAV